MAGDDLAGVEAGGEDRPLADPHLHPPPHGAGVEGVVVGVEAQVGLGRHAHREAAVGVRHRGRAAARIAPRSAARRSTGRSCRVRVLALVGLRHPLIELGLEVIGAAEAASRFEVGAHEAVESLQHALGLGVARPRGCARRPAGRRRRRRRPRSGARRRRGSPPRGPRRRSRAGRPSWAMQRLIPQSRSGIWREKISAPAPARE